MGIRKGKFNIKAVGQVMIDRYFLFFLLLIATIFTVGCSENADVNKPVNAPGISTGAAPSSNTRQSSSSNVMSGNPPVNTAPVDALENPNKRKVTDVPGAGRPEMRYEPAPESSQIAQAMNSSGQMYEVRIWTKHPQLLKVESIWVNEKNKALTIILRSGKIFNITTDRIPNVKSATANQFLELAGVQPSAATPAAKSGPKKTE